MPKNILIVAVAVVVVSAAGWLGCSKKKPTEATPTGPGTISGVVTKAADSTAFYGVAISTTPATSAVTTNADGRYTISNVNAGSYTVTASKNGYSSSSKNVIVTPNNTTTADFMLSVVSITIEWISIPAGTFKMGSLSSDPYARLDEQPQHTVYLDAYQISKYEITNAQFKVFMDSDGYTNSAYWTTDGWTWRTNNSITEPAYWATGLYNSGPGYPNYPVVGVSWYEAYAYCQWIGGHLPTEAQWEKAVRGTDSSNYWSWGSIWDASKCNSVHNTSPDTFTYSSPVGFFSSDRSMYGVYDMTGNVFEWCGDWYGSAFYSISPDSNPTGPATGIYRSLRLGAWSSTNSDNGCANRGAYYPYMRYNNNGIRVAR